MEGEPNGGLVAPNEEHEAVNSVWITGPRLGRICLVSFKLFPTILASPDNKVENSLTL